MENSTKSQLNLKEIIIILQDFKNSDEREDKIFYVSYLKGILEVGKRLYKLRPEEWLKKFLDYLSYYLEVYAKNIK